VCCQVEVSTKSLSLVQRSPTGCGASLCVIRNLVNEAIARAGLKSQRIIIIIIITIIIIIITIT
jgi:hypothetical protein